MKKILNDFDLAGYYPYNPIKQESMELGQKLLGCTPWIKGNVPGSIYQDLMDAGLISNPYFNMNSLAVEWVPTRWWVYVTHFDQFQGEDELMLHVEGINYKAHIVLNGVEVGLTENMFVPKKFLLNNLKERDNELKIIIEHAPDEFGQIGYTNQTFTQKSRFDYKWDFGIRMIDMGIWRPIYLESVKEVYVDDYYIRLGEEDEILLDVNLNKGMDDYQIDVLVTDNFQEVYHEILMVSKGVTHYETAFKMDDIKRWSMHDEGKPYLYSLDLKVLNHGKEIDVLSKKVGFRSLKFVSNLGSDSSALPYTLELNGKRKYIKGINIVPLDMMMGTVTKDRYHQLVKQLKDMNVNLVRIWGGGMIAPEEFYELCDAYGILIWQDFIQSSSGIDNFPSHLTPFLDKMADTVEYTTKVKRNHPSLAAFCGGNELMDSHWRPVDLSVPNIKLISDIIMKNCREVMFFPSTPSGERFAINLENQELNHDVHGDWRYLGSVKHYQFYNQMKNLLHSEFGVDGMTHYGTLEKTMPKNLLTVQSYAKDYEWRHRADWWNTFEREKAIFGDIKNLEDHTYLSQFIQAEGLRYIIDANRRMMPYQSGVIVWQMNEPFPNGSCTSLVDYYGNPKMAYYSAAQSYNHVVLSLSYEKLIYKQEEKAEFNLFCTSDLGTNITYDVDIFADDKTIDHVSGEIDMISNTSRFVESIKFDIPKNTHTIHFSMKCKTSDLKHFENHVLVLVEHDNMSKVQQKVIRYVKDFMHLNSNKIK